MRAVTESSRSTWTGLDYVTWAEECPRPGGPGRGPGTGNRSYGGAAIPIDIEFLEDGGLIGVGAGALTGQQIIDANRVVYATEEQTLACVHQIHDYRRVETIDISVNDIRRMAELDKRVARINPNIIVAVVTGSDVGFGLSRIWQGYTNEYPFVSKVFRSMSEARIWLSEQLKETPP